MDSHVDVDTRLIASTCTSSHADRDDAAELGEIEARARTGDAAGPSVATFSVGHTYTVDKPSFRERLLRTSRQDAERFTWVCAAILLIFVVGGIIGLGVLLRERGEARSHSKDSLGPSIDTLLSRFLMVGDWGRGGTHNQSEVAEVMARRAELKAPEFVLSLGDNFYPSGLHSLEGPQFAATFTNIYKQPSLQVPWYAVLGNHDYGDSGEQCTNSAMNQLTAWRLDPRFLVRRTGKMELAGGKVEFLFLDTSPHVGKYYKEEWAHCPGSLKDVWWEAELAELEQQLATSSAEWKLVVGHHPMYSNGEHGNTVELIERLDPLLKKYGVQAYFAGHDHSLEYLRVPGADVHYIVSGAGSKTREFEGAEHAVFQYAMPGFVACDLYADELVCDFLGIQGSTPETRPEYSVTIPRTPGRTDR